MRLPAVVLVALAFGLSACETQVSQAPMPAINRQAVSLDARQIQIVQAGVRSGLKDPFSAQFGPIRATKGDEAEGRLLFVCGLVNAKNSFGAFTGYQLFYGTLTDLPPLTSIYSRLGQGGTDIENQVAAKSCLDKGIAF